MELKLEGKTALVTGASSQGIGRAIAKGLAAEGVQLCIAARRRELLEQLADEIGASGGRRPVVIAADLLQADGPAKLAEETLARLGSIGILVNSAGFGLGRYGLNAPEEQWEREFALIFANIRKLSLAVVPDMIKHQWGRIISITGHSETRYLNGATASKAAVHGFSKGLSCEVGKHGITVNCIAPGKILSEQVLRKYDEHKRKEIAEEEIPVGRFGEPEELARLAVFLSSPLASYITGTVIPVDGGLRRYAF